jgi:hypothetical protein
MVGAWKGNKKSLIREKRYFSSQEKLGKIYLSISIKKECDT